MKKLFLLLFLVINVFSYDISTTKAFKKILKCEDIAGVEENIKNGNPQVCIDAAILYKKQQQLLPDEKKYYGEAYYNAGIIYYFGVKYQNKEKAFQMFNKAYKVDYSSSDLFNILGICYKTGRGTTINKFKAYKFYIKSAKMGNEYAQKNLDILCKESSWACK
jgi:TPR repeat protein